MVINIKKKFLAKGRFAISSLALGLAALLLLVTLSGCKPKQALSGTYVSADNNAVYLIFDDSIVSIYENDAKIDSGEYRFHNDNAIVFSFSVYAGSYTLDESKETLYFGDADDENFGEIAFVKEK